MGQGEFPPGLLNPGADPVLAVGPHSSWCFALLGAECTTRSDVLFNLLFTGNGVWLLLPASLALLLAYRLFGPPEVDEREEELRQLWADHHQRFRSGARRSSLRGVINSSYLPELRDGGVDGGSGAG
ncbi:unnamed protein product, partial [Discosporangium mesarthrocarpum]